MKKLFTLSAALFSLSFFAQAPVANPVVAEEDQLAYGVIIHPGDYVPEQLLVMLEPNASMGEVEQAFAAKGFVLKETKLISPVMRAWTITFTGGTNTEKALDAAHAIPQLQMAQFNHYVAHRVNIPNDAQFGNMWDMNNTGQSGGTPDADIDAPEAWDITTGGLTSQGDTIVVAVIDAGFDLAQPDLNFWKNYAEIPNNGIDDDNNGYIDDYDGWDAYNSDGVISSDLHGTHVSGTVGARGNNTIGVTGVNWGVKVMPVMGSDGTEAVVVEAYTYVMQARRLYNQTNGAQGAFVVSTNSSFGVDQGQPLQYPIWCAMYDSMGVEGILSAAATANQNWNIDQVGDIPTACTSDYLISVTNTTRFDQKNNSAGYGIITIDLGAPGTTIYSTIPNAGYGTLTGTSMATPHVAGAVALMYAAACPQLITDYKTNPDSIALMMKSYLLGNVDQISSMNGIVSSGGRLNVYHAVQGVESYPNCTPLGQNEQPQNGISLLYPNPASQNVQLIYRSNTTGEVQFVITDMLGQVVQTSTQTANAGMNTTLLDISALGAGVYFVQMIEDGVAGTAQRLVVQ